VLHLCQNMRLNTTLEPERKFAEWQLEVGQGKHTDENGNISLLDHMKCQENTVDSLIDTIYPGITTVNHSPDYFSEHTVLSGLNVDVDSLNKSLFLQSFLGRLGCFTVLTSFLPLSKVEGEEDPMLNYPVDYLIEIHCSGLPLAKLELKIGCPVMIL